LIQEVGQVPGIYPSEGRLSEDFLLKRGASHGIELLGLLTMHVSPIWILAALADASGAGYALIQQIVTSLKAEGLLDPNAQFATIDQLLDGLEKTSAHLADTLNLPPLDMASLRREWTQLKNELPKLPPASLPSIGTLERIWAELAESAAQQKRSVVAICSMIAVSTLREIPANLLWLSRVARTAAWRTGEVVGAAFFDHYHRALEEIAQVGFFAFWRRQFRPYLRAAAEQFTLAKESSTERLLHRTSKKTYPHG
ncbi:MAG: hypothetical protein JO211_06975, partial [Acidobacteriaceae bacterium]|nr:hypothetical protein [Acidobacteriaceae bacterium]